MAKGASTLRPALTVSGSTARTVIGRRSCFGRVSAWVTRSTVSPVAICICRASPAETATSAGPSTSPGGRFGSPAPDGISKASRSETPGPA
ncbi:hypothetical protein ACTTAF_03295 [Rhodobacter capsulatus]|uniref:hypothetical protein n=1 Tax=Rhodobacter capsulatus TaxID=1061 RepID=UPI004038CC17